jgi:KaiC/GvpD/RAD55 family RecA-like ATPase
VICLTPDVLQRLLKEPEAMWQSLARGATPRRLLIDSVNHLRQITSDEVQLRDILNSLLSGLRRQGVTALVLKELEERGEEGIPFEEYVVDAVIRLIYAPQGDGARRRSLEILKTRGQDHVAGRHSLKFAADGLQVFPHLRPKPIAAPREDRRAFLGLAGFDGLLGAGIPSAAQVMLVGDTGVGKTLSALLFLHEGLQCGDWCGFVDCDEVPAMTRRTMAHFGMATAAHERLGRLCFVDAYGREGSREARAVGDPTDLDEFLNVEDDLLDTLQAHAGQGSAGCRLCVDGMSTVLATRGYQAAIDFVAAHLRNLRARRVLSLDTYTSGALEERLMANITQQYDLVLSMRFAEIHGSPIRLGVIEKYRFGKVARTEMIFSVDPRIGIVSHQIALHG